ncbi:MAG: Uncharacterised protein [Marine Group II euryarchaeote MED-G33]|nr:MAG: Uncharacterised protein [Marine Group II euryarchaeote MED-G33]
MLFARCAAARPQSVSADEEEAPEAAGIFESINISNPFSMPCLFARYATAPLT